MRRTSNRKFIMSVRYPLRKSKMLLHIMEKDMKEELENFRRASIRHPIPPSLLERAQTTRQK